MAKNYQRRENYNQTGYTDEPVSPEVSEEPVLDSAAPEVSATAAIIEPEPVAVVEPVSTPALYRAAVTPAPIATPVISQPQKVTMLPVQSELTALAQAINPKQPVQARWQYTLFQLFKSVLENEDNSEFHQQWSAVLNFYHAAKGTAFSDMYMLRFSDDWPGSDLEFSLFRRLVHVVSQTSEPQSRRKSALMINFSRATEGLQEDAGNRLIGFYA